VVQEQDQGEEAEAEAEPEPEGDSTHDAEVRPAHTSLKAYPIMQNKYLYTLSCTTTLSGNALL
jgi:hypothetical protein